MLVLLMLMPCIISSRQRLGLVGSAGLGLLCCARRLVGLLHLLACNWRNRQRLGLSCLARQVRHHHLHQQQHLKLLACDACPMLWCCFHACHRLVRGRCCRRYCHTCRRLGHWSNWKTCRCCTCD